MPFYYDVYTVSIHAPAWRATQPAMSGSGIVCGFNPRPRMEGDPDGQKNKPSITMFQSTPPHGGRPCIFSPKFSISLVSIHAPAWRATSLASKKFGDETVSIHAPAWRATPNLYITTDVLKVSIHAPAWRATGLARGQSKLTSFQSTPPHGGRHPKSQGHY